MGIHLAPDTVIRHNGKTSMRFLSQGSTAFDEYVRKTGVEVDNERASGDFAGREVGGFGTAPPHRRCRATCGPVA
jgi:hypothetical protein